MSANRAPSLADLPDGGHAVVTRLATGVPGADAALLRRLAEIGFVEGEPVQVLRRGPGGRRIRTAGPASFWSRWVRLGSAGRRQGGPVDRASGGAPQPEPIGGMYSRPK